MYFTLYTMMRFMLNPITFKLSIYYSTLYIVHTNKLHKTAHSHGLLMSFDHTSTAQFSYQNLVSLNLHFVNK